MAGFLDRVKSLITVEDDYDYDYDDINYDSYDDYDEVDDYGLADDYTSSSRSSSHSSYSNNISPLHQSSSSDNVKIMIHEPLEYNDSPKIIDDILAGHIAIVNIEMLEKVLKRQVFDFISGATYALEAKMQKVAKDIFVIAPKGVEIDGKIKDQINSKGFFQL